MSGLELAFFLALLGGAWFWVDSLKAREHGLEAARRACRVQNLQLLDDTVAQERMRFARDDMGRLRLRRVYRFEYSDTGNNRRAGFVVLFGREISMLEVGEQRPTLTLIEGGRADTPPH